MKPTTPEGSMPPHPRRTEVATLGGGCFWCTEAVFSQLKGVEKVESGYSGGDLENPTYEQVSTGRTGHAETVQIIFDSDVISYKEILEIFFATHDPTTLNRQGADVGTQYRSVIFYHDEKQKTIADQVIKKLGEEGTFDAPIVTQVEPFKAFYQAEDYHKDYFKRHPDYAYCRIIINPKITKLRELFMSKLKLQLQQLTPNLHGKMNFHCYDTQFLANVPTRITLWNWQPWAQHWSGRLRGQLRFYSRQT